MPQRVQYAHKKGHDTDTEDIGKGDAGQQDSEFIFLTLGPEAPSLESHYPG